MKHRTPPAGRNPQQLLDRIAAAVQQHKAAGNWQAAYAEAMKAHNIMPKAVPPLEDAMFAAVCCESWQNAADCARRILKIRPDHLNALDGLSHALYALGDEDGCRTAGRRALEQRHAAVTAALPQLPPPPQPDLHKNGKKIIAFSLFGNHSRYIEPAVLNTQVCSALYPGRICRFYVDHSVPEAALARLRANGAEIICVDDEAAAWPGTVWRFLAADDPEAADILFRDADSVISRREARAVEAWLAGEKAFHIMRDYGSHTELMLAGLWGMRAGAVSDMRGLLRTYLQQHAHTAGRFADQYFLRHRIWPAACQSVCIHDSLFGFHGASGFPDGRPENRQDFHVGIDEGASQFAAAYPLPDGSLVEWRLHSRLAALPERDGGTGPLPESRIVCAYQTTVQNGKITGNIPRRYAAGFETGLSKISVHPL